MKRFALCLQLFADGGDGAAAVGGETEGVKPVPTGTESVDGQTSPDTDRQAQYSKFKEDYKDEYNAEVQSIVKDRLKKSNSQNAELNKRLGSLAPIMEHLAKKYGVTDGTDYDAIINAFNNDDSIYEDEAYEKGMTTEQVKAFHNIERENQALKEAEEERKRQAQFAEWDRQAEALKGVYPSFDIETELQNPQFRRMMNAGVDIRNAYEVAHKDELMRGAMQFSVQKANEKLTNAVASNKARPSENGLSSNAPAIVKDDISKLDRNQIADIKRRAAAGERITFK